LQKDQDSGGYIPQWIVRQIRYDFNGERILAVENDISISQDPYLKFKFVTNDKGTLTVSATDTKSTIFLKSKQI
jgi:sulfur-oxidizing protein SoxY